MRALLSLAPVLLWLFPSLASASSATEGDADLHGLHMLTLYASTVLMVLVIVIVGYAIASFQETRHSPPDTPFHGARFGAWSWIVVPLLVLALELAIMGNAHAAAAAPRGQTLEEAWVRVVQDAGASGQLSHRPARTERGRRDEPFRFGTAACGRECATAGRTDGP